MPFRLNATGQSRSLVVTSLIRIDMGDANNGPYRHLNSALSTYWPSRQWESAKLDLRTRDDGPTLSHLSMEFGNGDVQPNHGYSVILDVGNDINIHFKEVRFPRLVATIPMSTLTSLCLRMPNSVVRSWEAHAIHSVFTEAKAVTELVVAGESLCVCVCLLLGVPENRKLHACTRYSRN